MLLVVEDAHWIDPSTSELLREVVSRIHATPIYVLVTTGPTGRRIGLAAIRTSPVSSVGRLTRQQMRELIGSMLHPVSDELVDRIAARTDGVPLFVEELIRAILENGTRRIRKRGHPTQSARLPDGSA